jgi:hypothetical protein
VPNVPAILSPPPLVVPAQGPSSPTAAAGHFEHEIPFQELQLGKLLGSGSFGDVCAIPCNRVSALMVTALFAAATAPCGAEAALP